MGRTGALLWVWILGLLLGAGTAGQVSAAAAVVSTGAQPETSRARARIIEAAGTVEVLRGAGAWVSAAPGLELEDYDLLRTGVRSRAAVQLTDRSVVRLDQGTTFQVLPSRREQARRRFLLELGRLFFFNRERPEDVEFETPVATGAIRGTEFVLQVPGREEAVLDLLEGRVVLRQDGGEVEANGGESILLRQGREPVRRGLVAWAGVQWALHYPMVVDPAAIRMPEPEVAAWREALEAYRAGDVLGALRRMPVEPPTQDGMRLLGAALLLSVGQVEEALGMLEGAEESPEKRALRRLVATVRGDGTGTTAMGEAKTASASASEWLAESYRLQGAGDLEGAAGVARRAWGMAPGFGAAALRVSQLEFMLERFKAAETALEAGRRLAPASPVGTSMEGWIALARNRGAVALNAFDQALKRDGSDPEIWMGRGLALETLRRSGEALEAFQAAAALDATRSLVRSYLGKAWASTGDAGRGLKELGRAAALDPGDPTPWWISALIRQQQRDPNRAIRDLERSYDLNDGRAVFRSKLGLDQDRAMRGANLAQLYEDVGLFETAEAVASRAVTEDYSNFAAHQFLARSLAAREDPFRYDLRLETPRQNEQLLASLLAPAGAGGVSVLFAQQERLRYLVPPVAAVASETTYLGRGAWSQSAAVYGTVDRLDYAVDASYLTDPGWRANQDVERNFAGFSARQGVTDADTFYVQAGWRTSETGDVGRYADPSMASRGLSARTEQLPVSMVGWHHRWSPEWNTLVLATWAEDRLRWQDPERRLLFLRQEDGWVTGLDSDRARVDLDLDSRYRLGGLELQQIWQTDRFRVVGGGRYQRGHLESDVRLGQFLDPDWVRQEVSGDIETAGAFVLGQVEVWDDLRLDAGVGYASQKHPRNVDLPPFSGSSVREEDVSPRLGLTWAPGRQVLVQAAYGRSLGGVFFDPSLRLEPSRLAGFTQVYRSLIPESVVGLVPGTEFETAGVRVDGTLGHGLYGGVIVEGMTSEGDREVGAVSNSLPFPVPDTPTGVEERLAYREHALTGYLQHRLGRHLSYGVRYRVSVLDLETELPGMPRGIPGLQEVERDYSGALHQVTLSMRWQHHRGWLASWESTWHAQDLELGALGLWDRSFWQHDAMVGYRWPRQAAEVQVGVWNVADEAQELHPVHSLPALTPERTLFVRLRLNF